MKDIKTNEGYKGLNLMMSNVIHLINPSSIIIHK